MKTIQWLSICVCALWLNTAWPADIQAVLDSTDGSSAMVVLDAQTNQRARIGSDGIMLISNIVDGISGPRPALTIGGGADIQVGAGAVGYSSGTVVGAMANGSYDGASLGYQAQGQWGGAAIGYQADGANYGAAAGRFANGNYYGAALGINANATNFGAALGAQACGADGVAAGYQAQGVGGVAVGRQAQGMGGGSAVGPAAIGQNFGVAVGQQANGANVGAALGYQAAGYVGGVAIGHGANGASNGIAVGIMAQGDGAGIAVGMEANGAHSNIAIGVRANAAAGTNRIVIGSGITSEYDDSITLRGTLYLDGGEKIWYRPIPGAGVWIDLLWGRLLKTDADALYVKLKGDTMTGPLVIAGASMSVSTNVDRGAGARDVLAIAGGADVEIGLGADGYNHGVAVGAFANARNAGVALGDNTRAEDWGVALGNAAKATNYGIAISGIGWNKGVAVGYGCIAPDGGVGVGYNANGTHTNVAIGYGANAAGGRQRIAIGVNVENEVDDSARLRGTLYLDGGTSVLYRSTFGSGPWTSLPDAFVKKAGDTMPGVLAHQTNIAISFSADRGLGARSMLAITGGEDVEIGAAANAYVGGAALGYMANGAGYGVAVGYQATGTYSGVAVGREANGYYAGSAVGGGANAAQWGVALGRSANGAWTNIAIGNGANAQGGNKRIAIGPEVVNEIDHSARLRGTLYLDGGTGLFYRATFGSGTWLNWGDHLVHKSGDTMTGPLQVNTNLVLNYSANRGLGARTLLSIGGGTDIEIGPAANGYWFGTALGQGAAGWNAGVAVGWQANGAREGVAVGHSATGYWDGAAVGYAASGMSNGAAVGRQAMADDHGAALGFQANGGDHGVAIGDEANGQGYCVAIGPGANAGGGFHRTAIGFNVTNSVNLSTRIVGDLYLSSGTRIWTNGSFSASGWGVKAFTIDHPLDPANKVLRHYCMESPEVRNVYEGTATLDAHGEAIVALPEYFDALNIQARYLLTPVGAAMPELHIKTKVQNNHFTIGGGVAGGEVCWMVTAQRNDLACIEDLQKRPVEQPKSTLAPGQAAAENQAVNTGL